MPTQNYELDYSGKNIFAGIDVHLQSWNVSIMVEGEMWKTFSQNSSPMELKKHLEKNFPNGNYHSAYEAGFCGFGPHRELTGYGINNIVVNPADIPTTDKEKKQKDDARDSRKIVRSLYNNQLNAIHIPSLKVESMRELVRHRKTIVKEICRHRYRTKSFLYRNDIKIPIELQDASRHWSKIYATWLKSLTFQVEYSRETLNSIINTVEHLRKELLAVNRLLRKIEKESEYSETIRLLRTVPGIGLIMALTIITELENIQRFKNIDKLSSYVGIVPTTNSSGEKEKVGGITNRSNRQLRNMLIESSWIAIRNDPALMMKYTELRQRMDGNKAIVKIARKLLNRIKHVLVTKEPYEKGVVK